MAFFKKKLGLITCSHNLSGLMIESNRYISYLNNLNIEPEMFFFPDKLETNDVKNIKSRVFIKNLDKSVRYNYEENISLDEFIIQCDIILVFEIFHSAIFEKILSLNKKIVFMVNADCLLDWENKKFREREYISAKICKLQIKYKHFYVLTKNKNSFQTLKSYIKTNYITWLPLNEKYLIGYDDFTKKHTTDGIINIVILLGSGAKKNNRKSLEPYLDEIYTVLEDKKYYLNIISQFPIEYEIKKMDNIKIHHNLKNEEIIDIVHKSNISLYFSKYDGLGLTPYELTLGGTFIIYMENENIYNYIVSYPISYKLGTEVIKDKLFTSENRYSGGQLKTAIKKYNDIREYNDFSLPYNQIITLSFHIDLGYQMLTKYLFNIEKTKTIVSMTSYPKKKYSFINSSKNLILESDKIYLYLNEYNELEDYHKLLNLTGLFDIKLTNDDKALSKLKFILEKDIDKYNYAFSCDDDLNYVPHYISNYIDRYKEIGIKYKEPFILTGVARKLVKHNRIDRYNSPTVIYSVDKNGYNEEKVYFKPKEFTQKHSPDNSLVDLCGTGNSVYKIDDSLKKLLNKVLNSSFSFRKVSLDEVLAIECYKNNFSIIVDSKNRNFIRSTYQIKYVNFDKNGLHELKFKNKELVKSIENTLNDYDFSFSRHKLKISKKLCIVGWWSIEAHPVNIINSKLKELNYDVFFYPLRERIKEGKNLKEDICNFCKINQIEIMFWFNWKIELDVLKNIVLETKKFKVNHFIFNWDPVIESRRGWCNLTNFKKYMDIVDFTFISQDIDYDKDKYKILYPSYNTLHNELNICEENFLGDVCFVINYLSDERIDIINRLLSDGKITVHIFGPNELLKKFPEKWPISIYKGIVDKNKNNIIYNKYKISINQAYDNIPEYINERVSEIFYSKGIMLTNLTNSYLVVDGVNSFTYDSNKNCYEKVKEILNLYNKKIEKINYIKNNCFKTALGLINYDYFVLDLHLYFILKNK